MPNLQSFRVADLDAIWDVLASIHAPQLDTLILYQALAGTRISSVDKDYTFPALRKLYLIRMQLEPHVMLSLAHVTSQATDVIILDWSIQTIVDEGYAGVIWPRLKTLTCDIDTKKIIPYYRRFAENRPNKDLITFKVGSYVDDAELEALKEVGLVVNYLLLDLELEPFWPHDVNHFRP